MQVCPSCGRENVDDARFCNACGHELTGRASGAPETRKTVTVVFCDVSGSTALGERTDPESLRRVMTRYFETMRTVLESHGGTVEKFIGDAVMAVFGVPKAHEDDALRAVRAAAEMRTALGALNEDLEREHSLTIEIRIGVNTGEVIAGDPAAGHNVVTGDAVNTAARLEQSAGAGEIFVGDDTYALVRDAVVVEDIDPLDVKGKAAPLLAYRLLEVRPGVEGHVRRMDSPMVGRERPLRMLRETFEGATADRACALFTVMGVAGIGKTRLIREFLRLVDDVRPRVLSGRCLPYGKGITFWPITEMLGGIAGISEVDDPGQVAALIREALGDAPDAERIAAHLAALIGAGDSVVEVEPAWAVRRLFESVSAAGPLIAFFDDIHWAEPGLLDVIEHVADFSRDAPILLLCTARPEFFDLRPNWGGGKLRATAVNLEPLDDRESEELMANLLAHPALTPEIRQRIREAAQGNPLFVEEMLQMLLDDGSIVEKEGEWVATVDLSTIHVPPAISALLAARLDRLPADERATIEAASVEGEVFERAAVHALITGRPASEIEALITALVRKDLIVPAPSDLGGGEAFRFRHLLIRDAAYGGMSKQRRAEIHEAFAGWIEAWAGDRASEVDEVLGYHLEQAHALRAELGSTTGLEELGDRAATLLARAGVRARVRGDVPATVNLLRRAALLARHGEARIEMLIELTDAASEVLDHDTAAWAGAEGIAGADELGSETLRARAKLADVWARASHDMADWDEVAAVARAGLAILERAADRRGLAEAWRVLGWLTAGRGANYQGGIEAAQISAQHARAAGDRTSELVALGMQIGWMTWGPTPVHEKLARCAELEELVPESRPIQAEVALTRATAEAMLGHVEASRRSYAEGVGIFEDLGQLANVAFATQANWLVEWLAGDFAAVEAETVRGIRILEDRGEHSLLPLHRLMLAQAVVELGRWDEAEALAVKALEQITDPDDLTTQPLWRRVLGRVACGRGDYDEADRLQREAVELLERTDGPIDQAWAFLEWGQTLRAAGREAEAVSAFERALEPARRKGDVVTERRARELIGKP